MCGVAYVQYIFMVYVFIFFSFPNDDPSLFGRQSCGRPITVGLRVATCQQMMMMLLLRLELWQLLLWIVEWHTVAIGECQAIEVSKFTHNFWYLITFSAEANQATAADTCAANAAANNVMMLLQIMTVMMIVMRMRMMMLITVTVTVTMTVVVIVAVMMLMLMAYGRRALAESCILFLFARVRAADIQLLRPLQRARLAHLQATLAALLLCRRCCFALGESI